MMLVTSIIVNYLSFDIYNKSKKGIEAISTIPIEIQKWYGKDMPVEDNIYEILETKSIIHRMYYSEESQNVFLSLVYYPETKVDFHSPTGCLAGKGQILTKTIKKILLSFNNNQKEISINQLITGEVNNQTLVYYFYKSGAYLGDNYIKLRFNLALNKFSKNTKSGSLIRISTPIQNGNIEKSSQILLEFLNELYPFLMEFL